MPRKCENLTLRSQHYILKKKKKNMLDDLMGLLRVCSGFFFVSFNFSGPRSYMENALFYVISRINVMFCKYKKKVKRPGPAKSPVTLVT
ncbi:hypothetical protein L1887_34187 [Cichorium endivia]|nr:hypothetical protein L1887_34187 [Cichorium endivia]